MSENKTIKTTVVADTTAYRRGMQDATRETRDFTREVGAAATPTRDLGDAIDNAAGRAEEAGHKWKTAGEGIGAAQQKMRDTASSAAGAAAEAAGASAQMAAEVEALSSAVMLAGGVMGIGAIAAAGFGVAMMAGAREAAAMQLALDSTSNYAGQTVGSMQALSTQMADTGKITVGAAKNLTMELASSGKIGQGAFSGIASAAADFARVTGTEVSKVGPELVKLFEDPAKGAETLNEKMHFLTVAEIEQIKTLQDMGNKTEAQTLLAEKLNTKLGTIPETLNVLERAWREVGNVASKAWNQMMSGGRDKTTLENINEIAQDLERGTTDAYGGDGGARAALSRLLAQQVSEYQRTKGEAEKAVQNARDQEAQALIRENSKSYKAGEIRSKIARVKAQSEDGLSDEDIKRKSEALKELNKQLDDLLKPEKEKKGPKPRIDDDRVVSDWQKRVDLLGAEAAGQEKLTTVEQAYVSVLSEVSSGRLKMTNAGKARLATLAAEAMALEQTQLQEKEAAKAAEEHAKWVDALYQAQEKETTRLEEALKKEDERVSALGMSKEAVNQLAAAQLEEAAAAKEVYAANLRASSAFAGEFADAYQRAADEAQHQADVLRQTAGKKMEAATKEAQIETQKGWEKVGDDVARSLTDAIVVSGQDGRKLLERAFKATVIRVAVQPFIQGGLGTLTGAAGSVSTSGGSFGGVGNLLSTGSSMAGLSGMSAYTGAAGYLQFGSMASSFGTGLTAAAGGADLAAAISAYEAAGMGATAASISAGASAASALGGAASTVGSAISALSAAAPYLAVGLLVAQQLGVFNGPTYHHGGAYMTDTAGTSAKLTTQNYAGFDLGWGAYNSDRSASFDEAMKAMSMGIAQQITSSVKAFGGDSTGMTVASRFASDNSDYSVGALRVTDKAGAVLFDLDKHYTAEATKGMQEFSEDTVRALVGALKATKLGDEFSAIFQSVDPLTSSLDNLNMALQQASAIQQQISSLKDAVDSAFLQPAEQLDKAFGTLGKAVPVTVGEFESLVKAQDLNSAAGRDMATALMNLYPLWQQVQDAASQAADAALQAARQAADALRGNLVSAIDAVAGSISSMRARVRDADAAVASARSAIADATAAAGQKAADAQSALVTLLEQSASATRTFGASLSTYIAGLGSSSGGSMSPDARYRSLGAQLQSTSVLAQAGDQASRDKLTQVADAFLQASRERSTTSVDYARDEARVRVMLQGVVDGLTAQVLGADGTLVTKPISAVAAGQSSSQDQQIATALAAMNVAQADYQRYLALAAATGTEIKASTDAVGDEIARLRGAYDAAAGEQASANTQLQVALQALDQLGLTEEIVKLLAAGLDGGPLSNFATALGVSTDSVKGLQAALGLTDDALAGLADGLNLNVSDEIYAQLGQSLGVPAGLLAGLGDSLGVSPLTMQGFATALGWDAEKGAELATAMGWDQTAAAQLGTIVGFSADATALVETAAAGVTATDSAVALTDALVAGVMTTSAADALTSAMRAGVGISQAASDWLAAFGGQTAALGKMSLVLGVSPAAQQAIDLFSSVSATATTYGSMVDSAYQNAFGRQSDSAGRQYWMGQLYSGTVTQDSFMAAFLAGAKGDDREKALAYGKKLGLPGFAVGTNFVLEDMPAFIHRGERIMPAADNALLFEMLSRGVGGSGDVVAALKSVLDELVEIKRSNASMSKILAIVTRGGDRVLTTTAG